VPWPYLSERTSRKKTLGELASKGSTGSMGEREGKAANEKMLSSSSKYYPISVNKEKE